MADLPLGVSNAISQLHSDLSVLQSLLAPVLQYGSLEQLNSELNSSDNAKLNVMLAYTLQSLYFTCMHTYGESMENHKIQRELNRIKEMVQEVREITAERTTAPRRTIPPNIREKAKPQCDSNKQISKCKTVEEKPLDDTEKTNTQIAAGPRPLKGSTPLPKMPHLEWKQQLDRILGTLDDK